MIFFSTACSQDDSTKTVQPRESWFTLKIGDKSIKAQIAVRSNEQRKGLMGRKELEEDHGMLFPYEEPRQMSFWMANTSIPLDVGFFDESGILREVHRMQPHDTSSTKSRQNDIQFALEMNAGWFRSNNIKAGDPLDLQLVAEAIEARGFDPNTYGL